MKNIKFFHIKLTSATMHEIIENVDCNLRISRNKILITSVNAAMTVISRDNSLIADAINKSDIVNIDGMAIYFAVKLLGLNVPERVAGPDLFYNLVKLSAQKGYKPYFLGAKPEVIQAMVERFKAEFPELTIAGFHHGYYNDNDLHRIFDDIEKSQADMLFLGITSPKREMFTNLFFEKSNVPVWKGVGGSFDIYANQIKRAPIWVQKIGMEWFYRLCQEPKRMFKRYLVTNTIFLCMISGEVLRKITGKKKVYFN